MNNEQMLERIKELCEEKGMTISELERKVDVSNSTIARWKKSMPSVDNLQKVAKILNTTLDYLVTGEKEQSAKIKVLAREAGDLTDTQLDLIYSMIQQLKDKE